MANESSKATNCWSHDVGQICALERYRGPRDDPDRAGVGSSGWNSDVRRFSNIERGLAHVDLLIFVMYYAFVCCAAFVLWATRDVFNAAGYRSANALVAWLILTLLFLPPLALLLWAWFSILVIRFGRRVDSPLWQTIGAIYLIAVVLFVAATAIGFTDLHMSIPFAFMVLPELTLLAGWLCHGVCLVRSARTLAG